MGKVEAIESVQDFDTKVVEKSKQQPVIVDFWAEWCGPCKKLAPSFEKCAEEFPNTFFVKVNVDELEEIQEKYEADSLPVFIAFKDGKEVDRAMGGKWEVIEPFIKKNSA